MKRYLLTIITIGLLASCSKSENSPDKPNGISLGNDSLVTRLSLKIADKENLKIDKQLFKDSKNGYLIAGLKNNKYWIGYFDKSGSEVTTKTYDDPTEMKGAYGKVIKVSFSFIFGVYEAGNKIIITRQIRDKEGYEGILNGFVENETILNINSKNISTKYSEVVPGGPVPFTYFIGPWFENNFLSVKILIDDMSLIKSISNQIIDDSGVVLATFPKERIGQSLEYYTTSLTEYITRNGNILTKYSINNIDNAVYSIKIFPDLPDNAKLEITSKSYLNNILSITAKTTTFEGVVKVASANVDLKTGKIL